MHYEVRKRSETREGGMTWVARRSIPLADRRLSVRRTARSQTRHTITPVQGQGLVAGPAADARSQSCLARRRGRYPPRRASLGGTALGSSQFWRRRPRSGSGGLAVAQKVHLARSCLVAGRLGHVVRVGNEVACTFAGSALGNLTNLAGRRPCRHAEADRVARFPVSGNLQRCICPPTSRAHDMPDPNSDDTRSNQATLPASTPEPTRPPERELPVCPRSRHGPPSHRCPA